MPLLEDITIDGVCLESRGFVGASFYIEGLGLNTFGFLYPLWHSAETGATATWASADPSVTTTWTKLD